MHDYLFSERGRENKFLPTLSKVGLDGKHRRRKNVETDVGNWWKGGEWGVFEPVESGGFFHFLQFVCLCWLANTFTDLFPKNVCKRQTVGKKRESKLFLHISNPNLDAHQDTQKLFSFPSDVGRSSAIWHYYFAEKRRVEGRGKGLTNERAYLRCT